MNFTNQQLTAKIQNARQRSADFAKFTSFQDAVTYFKSAYPTKPHSIHIYFASVTWRAVKNGKTGCRWERYPCKNGKDQLMFWGPLAVGESIPIFGN